jgi:hypothetical protein
VIEPSRGQSGINLKDIRLFGEYNASATRNFLSLPSTRARLGVPAWRSFGTDAHVSRAMEADVMRSYKALLPRLLRELPLGVLLYQGQFDWSARAPLEPTRPPSVRARPG